MRIHTVWLAIGATFFLFAILAWMMLDNACTLSTSLGVGESLNQCYARWIGALSGWAAAIAAIFTLIILRQTLAIARESNDILSEQTSVVTGNLLPVFNHNGKAKSDNREIFRFWNYNRRDVTVLSIQILEPKNIFFAFLEYGRNDAREKTLIKQENFREVAGVGNLLAQNRRVRLVDIVTGTPVGQRCRPITFRIMFADPDYSIKIPPQDVSLSIEWRYRDENRDRIRTLKCATSVGVLTVDEEEDDWLQAEEDELST